MAKYNASDITKYFLWKAKQEEELISNLKLQKLLYYAQGLYLVCFDSPLFDDAIQAWNFGPVVPEIYHEYKPCGPQGIPPDDRFQYDRIASDVRVFLDEIYEVFGQFSASKLISLSHSDKCWIDANPSKVISHESMKKTLTKYLSHEKEAKSS